ncbi:hypothetical protein [Clostridium formicaceticum]|uniref:Uncharacterized protein n=1 Tax=Clostridium formicaceticum TaxID=1497 RepID=A0AAC9RPV0_9CLOT|nr:hypothetical protein [Clostridium formicaceticum]AOY74688.1 hypothetical protein BJL90_01190 [Clostridium formicaceticum]ARE89065.1 hypothetical protein CLFO_34710 [Clostridium formicaceticum]
MPHTSMIAKVKKIDITNKVTSENWSQTISITLSDIELNDENLIAIRKFRPNEEVKVQLQSLQLTMEEVEEREKLKKECPMVGEVQPSIEDSKKTEEPEIEDVTEIPEEEPLFHIDYDESPPDPSKILKTFDFSKT